jgi:hypothetical protein
VPNEDGQVAPMNNRPSEITRSAISTDRDFELFKLAAEHFRNDLQLFWQRCNLYLVVNVALVSVYSSLHVSSLQSLLAGFGFIISIFWFVVIRGSAYWIKSWRQQLGELDELVDSRHIFAEFHRPNP